MFINNRLLLAYTLLISLLTGCVTPKQVVRYAPSTLTNSAKTLEANGLKLTIDPIFDAARSEQFFDTDALADGIFPIYVCAENNGTNASFLVQRESLKLSSAVDRKTDSSAIGTDIHSDAGSAVGSVGAVLVSAPMIFYGTISVANSAARQFNFVQAELQDKSISPGEATCGFVYFQIPEGNPPLIGQLIATIRETRTQKDVRIEIPFTR